MNAVNEITKSLNAIEKALPNVCEEITSPDDKTMISNIIDMLKQILGAGGASTAPEMIMEQMADTSEEMKIGKEKKVDGAIGDEGADIRLEDQTPVTENAMAEIGKSLKEIKSFLAGNPQKSKPQANTAVTKSLQAIVGAMKGMAEKQHQHEVLMKSFMDKIGLSEDIIQKAMAPPAPQIAPAGRPSQQADMMAFATELMKAVNQGNVQKSHWGGNPMNNPWENKQDVKKSYDPVLDHLFTK